MVSSISRNWVGGLSSGLDTQSLIDQLIEVESFSKYSLERKRNTLTYQQDLLQEVNLKMYELQNKATDLTFSKTFNSKTVDSTDSRVVNAKATTEAAIGSYTVHVRQLATATSVSSRNKLASAIELGHNVESTSSVGGSSTTLSSLGVNPDNLEVRIVGGGSGTFNVSPGVSGSNSVQDMVTLMNVSISNKPELKGKLNVSFDEKNNRLKFNLLDPSLKLEIADTGASNIISSMFEADGQIALNKDIPVKDSTLKTIRSGLNTTIADMGITPGIFTIERNGTGSPESFDISGLAADTTVDELINYLNGEIDSKNSLVKGGTATGNPKDRLVEFRFDGADGKLQLVNTSSADTTQFTVANGTSNFSSKLFGAASKTSTPDQGEKLVNETFSQAITAGVFTVDGVQITVNPQTDDLRGVLSRISALTEINATYDSENDLISFTRKDGSNAAIGVGSSTDTSNFLGVTGMIAGNQASAAKIASSANLGKTLADARTGTINSVFGVGSGTLRVMVNGQANDVTYSDSESLKDILDRVSKINGVSEAYYDAASGKVNIIGSDKGTSATLQIQDAGGGTLASALGLGAGVVTGQEYGSSLVSARPISDVKSSSPLSSAGFARPVTAGTFSINGVQFYIGSTTSMTLDKLIDSINSNKKVGVKAHYDPTNGEFVLTSSETGNRAIAIGSSSDTSNFLSAMGLTGAPQNIGKNAIYKIDGVYGGAEQISQTNSVSGAVKGVTFDLFDTTGASGSVVNINADTETAMTAIKGFVDSYNEVTQLVYSRLTEERDWDLTALSDKEIGAMAEADVATYENAFKVGLLAGDNTLRSIRSQMRLVMSSIVPGADSLFNSLSDLGITTGAVGSDYQDTMVGSLKISNEDTLKKALGENPDKVAALFNQESTDTNKMGIARRLKTALNEYTKSDGLLTKKVGRTGVTSNNEMAKQISTINTQISSQEERLRSREEALLKQFASLEKALSNYQSQSSAFSSQLSQMTGK
ncbi:MAG TPA: flagellar filament capping protein FliD [Candidatus Rifleibacterium sp.]|nr:flagellar filament capping protein FliD [Candidatus Rifleibacterium sp.]